MDDHGKKLRRGEGGKQGALGRKQTQRLHVLKIIPTRCNNCVLFFANAFTLHVSGDNLTHHQQYMCCIWPQVSRHTLLANLFVVK